MAEGRGGSRWTEEQIREAIWAYDDATAHYPDTSAHRDGIVAALDAVFPVGEPDPRIADLERRLDAREAEFARRYEEPDDERLERVKRALIEAGHFGHLCEDCGGVGNDEGAHFYCHTCKSRGWIEEPDDVTAVEVEKLAVAAVRAARAQPEGVALDLTREEARQLVLHDELKGDELLERLDWSLLDSAHAKLRAFLAGRSEEG